jgi:glycosyltransferase involved in cell wall biosynthesis
MSKSRILFILHFPPPIHGSSIVGKQIMDCELINNTFNCEYVNLTTSQVVDEIGKKGLIKYIRALKIYLVVLFKLIIHRYDLCYLAITVTKGGILKDSPLVFLCKLFGRKVIIHQHNKGVSLFQNIKLFDVIYKLVYKDTKVVLLSWYLYPDVSKYVNKKDVFICPNGVMPNDKVTSDKLTNKVTQILFVSNLIESKGCYILLEACKILKDKGLSFNCNFVGAATKAILKDEFIEQIDLRGLSNQVFYLGPKYGNDKNRIFEKSDIFVFPTSYHKECFPLVLLEAMQFSLPVVSTFEGGIPDVVEDNVTGFLVLGEDAVTLAEKLELLISNPELCKEMGKAGNKKYLNSFTLEHFEKNMFNILQDCIKL